MSSLPLLPIFACLTFGLLGTNILLALLVLRYLSTDNAELPLKLVNLTSAANALAIFYLFILAFLAIMLVFRL